MSNQEFFLFSIFILNLISFIICQFENDSMSKAIACMTVINLKFKGSEPDPSLYSTMMLKCFITIKDSQSQKLLLGMETGSSSLSKKEIDKLTDYESLRDMNPNELRRKSQELEKAIKGFKKLQDQFAGEAGDSDIGDYDDYDDEDFNRESPSRINFFSLIPKGLFGIFNIFNNYLSLFLVFVILYFGLLMLRKINDSERKMNKKKRMIMKRVKEEYDEDDDEEEEEENEQEIEEKIKKIKKVKNKKIK